MTIWQAILLAIVEGLTEFLPVSSTGHMIIVSHLLGIQDDQFTKLFEVNIQLGAILSVVVLYRDRFFQSFTIYVKLLAAFIPTAILGLLFDDLIDAALGSVQVVAASLLLGGIILLFVDSYFKKVAGTVEELSIKSSSIIGIFQALSMVPGVSRSAATIIGGQTQGMSRKSAAEFSFLLAVPTMAAATGLKLLKGRDLLFEAGSDLWINLAVGNLVAFVVALLAMRGFIAILMKAGFRPFGIYRVVVGTVLLVMLYMGYSLHV